MRFVLVSLTAAFLTSCMSTKIILSDKWDPREKPAYVDYVDSYWFGFRETPAINLQKVCMDQKPLAVQRIKTAEDAMISVFTLAIYTPTTVKVWCGE